MARSVRASTATTFLQLVASPLHRVSPCSGCIPSRFRPAAFVLTVASMSRPRSTGTCDPVGCTRSVVCRHMRDPTIMAKIQKLIAAGVLQMK